MYWYIHMCRYDMKRRGWKLPLDVFVYWGTLSQWAVRKQGLRTRWLSGHLAVPFPEPHLLQNWMWKCYQAPVLSGCTVLTRYKMQPMRSTPYTSLAPTCHAFLLHHWGNLQHFPYMSSVWSDGRVMRLAQLSFLSYSLLQPAVHCSNSLGSGERVWLPTENCIVPFTTRWRISGVCLWYLSRVPLCLPGVLYKTITSQNH